MSINQDFQCIICLQVLETPVRHNSCNKHYCSNCLNQLLMFSITSNCPNCRQQIFQNDLYLDTELATTIALTNFFCVCGQTIPYSEVNAHLEICQASKQQLKPKTIQPKTKVTNRWTFECPVCHQKNLERANLIEHFKKNHGRTRGVCPICTSMPWGDPKYVSSNLLGHMETRHKMDYDTLTDYTMNDDEILRKVLQDSLKFQ